jgi:hypothetical protein
MLKGSEPFIKYCCSYETGSGNIVVLRAGLDVRLFLALG